MSTSLGLVTQQDSYVFTCISTLPSTRHPKHFDVFGPKYHQEHSDMVVPPFLRLAAEHRNQIYRYLLSTEYTKQWPKEEDPVR